MATQTLEAGQSMDRELVINTGKRFGHAPRLGFSPSSEYDGVYLYVKAAWPKGHQHDVYNDTCCPLDCP
jgi:hypothetical protein